METQCLCTKGFEGKFCQTDIRPTTTTTTTTTTTATTTTTTKTTTTTTTTTKTTTTTISYGKLKFTNSINM